MVKKRGKAKGKAKGKVIKKPKASPIKTKEENTIINGGESQQQDVNATAGGVNGLKYDLNIPLDDYPLVSVLTPTYNRSKFIPYLKKCFLEQEYPQNKMEWIIIDDGTEPVHELFSDMSNVNYVYLDEKINIGQKRNMCNELANGEFMVCMDDDDYYPPTRVSAAVKALYNNDKHQIAGASKLYMYYSDIKEIYEVGPYADNHCTNGTMAYTKEYAKTHKYDEYVTHAEEKSFLDEYKYPCFQMVPHDVMMVMSHSQNTFDKRTMRDGKNRFVKRSKLKITDFIKDKQLLDFYSSA
jgi:glycosyltransferase involved in cell wall biosynthesis